MIKDLQERILREKERTDTCILAHSYMSEEISEIADFTGDSFALSVKAKSAPQKNIIMCGVRFMAETVKILSPSKRVVLANPDAGCPMAEGMDADIIALAKQKYPDYTVVAYVNTTAGVKAISDVCVTSSSAVKICRAIPQKNILFIPDANLGAYVRAQVPEKNFKLLSGGCPIHARVEKGEVISARRAHPNALVLIHPECSPEAVDMADYVGSTAGIMEYALNSANSEFIIGTENSVVEHLRHKCPEKRFYPLSKDLVCHNMRLTTLTDVLDCLEGRGGEEIFLDGEIRRKARISLDRMIEYGG